MKNGMLVIWVLLVKHVVRSALPNVILLARKKNNRFTPFFPYPKDEGNFFIVLQNRCCYVGSAA
jgi:hypothetical protein